MRCSVARQYKCKAVGSGRDKRVQNLTLQTNHLRWLKLISGSCRSVKQQQSIQSPVLNFHRVVKAVHLYGPYKLDHPDLYSAVAVVGGEEGGEKWGAFPIAMVPMKD